VSGTGGGDLGPRGAQCEDRERPEVKYGAHSLMFVERWSDAQVPVLERAQALGLDWMEIAVGDDVQFSAAATRKAAAALGLGLTIGPGGAWPEWCDISSASAEERAAGRSWHERQIDLASDLGALAYCGALYGHPGVIRRHRPSRDEFSRIAEELHALCAHAERLGVLLAIEPMSHFRTHLVNTPAQLMDLVARTDHPNLRTVLDTYHLVTEIRDYAQAVEAAGASLWAVHACENDRGVPGGGLVPWKAVFEALRTIGFDGHVLMESYNSGVNGFAWERGLFQDVCPDAGAFVRQGLTFLKACERA